MINIGNVIRMRVPFPNISSDLATQSHMYICRNACSSQYEFVKCQTLKPYILVKHTMQHFYDEAPDISRNPFAHTTRIDCDKTFNSSRVKYDDRLITTSRADVVEDVLNHVAEELLKDGYKKISMNESELVSLNYLITWL